jgi:uncharacterized membrane protein YkoI
MRCAAGFALAAVLAAASGCAAPPESEEHEGMEAARLLGRHEPVPPGEALQAAAGRAPGGTPVGMELTTRREGGKTRVVWEIEFLADGALVEVCVDAVTGSAEEVETDDDAQEATDAAAALSRRPPPMADALASLQAAARNGLPLEMELDDDDGRTTWEAEVGIGGVVSEWELDPASGRWERDDD